MIGFDLLPILLRVEFRRSKGEVWFLNRDFSKTKDMDEDPFESYDVVVNHEEQYSIWPTCKDLPLGWEKAGKSGPKEECLEHIKVVWTDMRPKSLRERMAKAEKDPAPAAHSADLEKDSGPSLVELLCEGSHEVELNLRPAKSIDVLKDRLEMKYIHVLFSGTQGGTELGLPVDESTSQWNQSDIDKGEGKLHLEGGLKLDFVPVRCVVDIDIATFRGTGYLVKEG